ncbi:alanine--glyoxylate aminotransferase family protein [Limosilactobacillus fermentum]
MSDLTIKERLIMTPGPASNRPAGLPSHEQPDLQANLIPISGTIMDDTMELTRQAFETKNKWASAVDGSGRAGLEALMSNIISKGDKVLVPVLGRFGNLGIELAQRAGGEVITM